ncbi:DUF4136 domain-containing protein [Shewanella goraebulensis]|uniref:DUF4136 domain-containing protein n=1 Tax=Shewanella goraebulensis TaxID=3050637 RepID=UPI00254BA559|nr:DUF4136 domain-containing protein [Shewanella goraebulensis]
MLIRLLMLFMVIVCLNACKSTNSNSDYDTKYDFSQLESFHFIDTPDQGDQLSAERIRANIRTTLTTKGFVEQQEQSDFLVSYAFLTKDKPKSSGLSIGLGTGTSGSHGGVGVGTSMGIPIGSDSAKIQVIQVDIIDAKENRLIWRGTDEFDFESGGDEKVAQTSKTISNILAQFPPVPKAK